MVIGGGPIRLGEALAAPENGNQGEKSIEASPKSSEKRN